MQSAKDSSTAQCNEGAKCLNADGFLAQGKITHNSKNLGAIMNRRLNTADVQDTSAIVGLQECAGLALSVVIPGLQVFAGRSQLGSGVMRQFFTSPS